MLKIYDSPLFNILKNEQKIFIFDTETTGLTTRSNVADLIEFSSIEASLIKKLDIETLNDNKLLVVLNNKYSKTLNYIQQLDKNKYLITDNDKEETILIIENDIPLLINKKKGENKTSYKLLFDIVGEFDYIRVEEKLFGSDKEIDSDAVIVHKIYDSNYLLNKLPNKDLFEIKQYILNIVTLFKEKVFSTSVEKKIKDKIKKYEKDKKQHNSLNKYLDKRITLFKKELENLNKNRKILNVFIDYFDSIFTKDKKNIDKHINKLEYYGFILKEGIDEKDYIKQGIMYFLLFLKKYGFRDVAGLNNFKNSEFKDYIWNKVIENENIVKLGHNVYTFDIKNVIEPTVGKKLKDHNIVDTMYLQMKIDKTKQRKTLNQIVSKAIEHYYKFYISELKSIISKELLKNDEFNYFVFKELIEYQNSFDKTEIENILNMFDEYGYNNSEKEKFKDLLYHINELNMLIEQRDEVHTALIDIKLNLFAFGWQISKYIEKFGFTDIDKQIKFTRLDKNNKKTANNIKISGYLGLQTDGTKGVITKNKDLLNFIQNSGFTRLMISDDDLTFAYDNYNIFNQNKIENLISTKIKITDIDSEYNYITILFGDKKTYFNSILAIKNYEISLEELLYLLNKDNLNLKIFIHPELDKYIKHEKVYVQVSPFINYDYDNVKFNNKRVLWINNKYIDKNDKLKALYYVWKQKLDNELIDPIRLNDIIQNPHKYNDYYIPTVDEILNIFPYEKYSDIYLNSEEILSKSESFSVDAEHLPFFPSTEYLLKLPLTSLKTPEDYKKLMLQELSKYRQKRNLDYLIKKYTFKHALEKIVDKYFNYDVLSKLNEDEKHKIVLMSNLVFDKNEKQVKKLIKRYTSKQFTYDTKIEKELYDMYNKMLDENFKRYEERINYEVEALTKFSNYDVVFNYYFFVRSVLETLQNKYGIGHGPGRGSAAGSIISFIFGITDVDPIEYGLLFERFLNPYRVSMPDIDIDFPYTKNFDKDDVMKLLEKEFSKSKEELINIIKRKYPDFYDFELIEKFYDKFIYTIKILTVSKATSKVIAADLFRLMGMNTKLLNEARRNFDDELSIVENIKNINEFESYDKVVEDIVDSLEILVNLKTGEGVHAGGIKPGEIPANFETILKNNDTSSYDKDTPRNEVKLDMLGLDTIAFLEELRTSPKTISNVSGQIENFDIVSGLFDDPKIYKLLRDGLTANVFQVESDGMKKLLQDMNVDNFSSLIAALSLYRPGPMKSGDVDKYIINKRNILKNKLIESGILKVFDINFDSHISRERVEKIHKYLNSFSNIIGENLSIDYLYKVLNSQDYFDTEEFVHKIKSKLEFLINTLSNNPNISVEELEEIKNDELEIIEKKFFDYFKKNNKNIDTALDETIKTVKEWEIQIITSETYKKITEETYNTIVYQEQIMEIVKQMAGFTKGEADALRKVIAKSKKDEIKKFKDKIINGLNKRLVMAKNEKNSTLYIDEDFEVSIKLKNGNVIKLYNSKFYIDDNGNIILELTKDKFRRKEIETKIGKSLPDKLNLGKAQDFKYEKSYDLEVAEYLFDNIVGFGSYAFNKSHAASYAKLTYETAWWKYYYPEMFYAIGFNHASVKTTQAMIDEINSQVFTFKNGNKEEIHQKINIKLTGINKLKNDFDYDLNSHTVFFTPSVIKSIKEFSIIAIKKQLDKRKKFNNLIEFKHSLGNLIDKRTFEKLGTVGILDDISYFEDGNKFTDKIYYKYGGVIFEALKNEEKEARKELEEKISVENNVPLAQIKKELTEFFKLKFIEEKNEVYNIELQKIKKHLQEIKSMYTNGKDVDLKEIDTLEVEISKIEEKITPLSDDEIKFLNDFKLKYKKQLYDYFVIRKKNDFKLIDKYIKEILTQEEYNDFIEMFKNQKSFDLNEKNSIYADMFGEFNFENITIELSEIDRENLIRKVNEYYKDIRNHLISEGIEEINKNFDNYFKIGNTPKILVITETPYNRYEASEVYFNGKKCEKVIKKGKNGKDYINFLTEDGISISYDWNNKKYVGKKRINGVWKEVDGNIEIIYDYEKDIIDLYKNKGLDKENIAFIPFLPLKTKNNKNLIKDGFIQSKFKELLIDISPSAIMMSGSNLIDVFKRYHKIDNLKIEKNSKFYQFNLDKDSMSGIGVLFFDNFNGLKFALKNSKTEIQKNEINRRREKIIEDIINTINKSILPTKQNKKNEKKMNNNNLYLKN